MSHFNYYLNQEEVQKIALTLGANLPASGCDQLVIYSILPGTDEVLKTDIIRTVDCDFRLTSHIKPGYHFIQFETEELAMMCRLNIIKIVWQKKDGLGVYLSKIVYDRDIFEGHKHENKIVSKEDFCKLTEEENRDTKKALSQFLPRELAQLTVDYINQFIAFDKQKMIEDVFPYAATRLIIGYLG